MAEGRDVEDLARDLVRYSEAYYSDGAEVSDAEYDNLEEQLRDLAPDHPVLARVGAPPKGKEWPKAKHEIAMGSLNKVNGPDDLRQWAGRCDELAQAEGLAPISEDLVASEKLDGLSIEVLYEGGAFESAITRGDGSVGERISPNVRMMQGVLGAIRDKRRLSLRGEIILRRSQAENVASLKTELDPRFSGLNSLRNAAAGLARATQRGLRGGCRMLSVLFYDIDGIEGLSSEKEKFALLEEFGFSTPRVFFGDVEGVVSFYETYVRLSRDRADYEIDGLVVRANLIETSAILGELNNRPRAAIAFKFENETAVTTLRKITWSTGDTGRITPIAEISPVRLVGATVRQASLHNLANVRRLAIDVGDQVLVSRRNDVIPYVEKVVTKALGPGSAENGESPPERCTECGGDVTMEGEYLACKNADCPARKIGRLKTWIRELGLLKWGEKTLERLYREGLAREPSDLYRLRSSDIESLEGFGETSAKNLLEPLLTQRQIPLTSFIAALGVETVSRETAKLLVGAGYESVEDIAHATTEELAAIPGLGEIKAEKILQGMRARLPEVARLAEVNVEATLESKATGGPLEGLSFCFSGTHSRPRKVLQALVEKNGGSVANTVTKGVSFLVLEDANSLSSKALKAKKLGTEVIDEARFLSLLPE